MRKIYPLVPLFLLLVLVACDSDREQADQTAQTPPASTTEVSGPAADQPQPTAEAAGSAQPLQQEGVLISELLPGIPGNNNHEFIELYNAGGEAVDLNGWSLWYLLGSGQEETLIVAWQEQAEVPPLGHFLLVRQDRDVGVLADTLFDVALFERKGGILLRDAQDNTVDTLGYGDAPQGFFAGSPAPVPVEGNSLERLPGGAAGNGVNSGDNAADFVLAAPNPQNSGSPLTPAGDQTLSLGIELPDSVEPGTAFDYVVEVTNSSGVEARNVQVSVPLPPGFEVTSLPEGASEADGRASWELASLAAGEESSSTIGLRSPFTYTNLLLRGAYAEAENFTQAYGAPRMLAVAGGSIPIATARTLTGSQVTVEGIATMYTGGYFAGTTGTKFYLEDETGGVQIYIPGGMGAVNVNIGDRVRVSGGVEIYRSSVEVIPGDFTADVEILEENALTPVPTAITIEENENDDRLLGRLNVIEGSAARIEEFSFSYEIDLIDSVGNMTLVYIEKDTGVTAEPLELGEQYRVVGISEAYDDQKQIKPRLQSDIVQIFPPILRLELRAPNSIQPGEQLTYTINIYNHTDERLTNLRISARPPSAGATLGQILDGGELDDGLLVWEVEQIEGDGARVQLRFSAVVKSDAVDPILMEPVTAVAEEWVEPAETLPYLTFVGSGVPIWAIQGTGLRSPYVGSEAATEGVVTAVFPELQGFWIQESESDDDPSSSAGLFVLVGDFEVPLQPGDLVQLHGKVREISSQTALQVVQPDDIQVVSSGNDLPEAVIYDPPLNEESANAYKESLEGMVVTINEPAVVVGPSTRYGEYALVRQKWGVDTVRRIDEAGFLIFVDDGSYVTHQDQSTLPYAVTRGDVVSDITGPLAYTFNQYKIEPITLPSIAFMERELPAYPAPAEGEFSVATFNVENLFDLLPPHPSSPPMPTVSEYRLKRARVAEAIIAMGSPTILALQEVENIDVLETLVEEEQIAAFGYMPFLIEGDDSRGIDVAFLVRGDQAVVQGVAAYPAPEGIMSRPTLVISVTLSFDGDATNVYLLNNHFTSLSGGEAATEPRRTDQAAWNVTVADRIRAQDPDAHIIILGDLNSFIGTLPIDTIEETGFRHVYDFFGSEDAFPYTYIFEGRTQTLDHMLVTEGLYDRLISVSALHINADYPIAGPDDPSPRGFSDHDPLIATFSLLP